jgi:uncharacterized protein
MKLQTHAIPLLTLALAVLTISVVADGGANAASPTYQAEIMKWRERREASLKTNWLTLVGLSWLKEGPNRFGSDANNEVVLPRDKAPAQAGVFELKNGAVSLHALPQAAVKIAGKLATDAVLEPDTTNSPTIMEMGDLRMLVIKRNQRLGIRTRDLHSDHLRSFKGLQYFPIQDSYLVTASFVPFDKARQVSVPTVLGEDVEMSSPGYVEFTLNGTKLRLEALIEEGEHDLFFILKDQTSRKQTYPAGRFLYSEMPKDGKVVLDFNKAYTPPCGFTPYATCPLPPKENYLKVAVEAGEMYAGH